ncbi:MAG: TonB-dependent receptor, partial [Bacteroidia bacterium]
FYHPTNKMSVTVGGRVNYWNYNKQFLFSPRASFSIKPEWQRDILFRIATGLYMQPPFYKEMRRPNGSLNSNIKAQSSLHFVLGADYNLVIWSRPFKLTSEVYYKHMQNLIPFMVENVKVVYQGENQSHGYAVGADFKINGEFVEGVESWVSLSMVRVNIFFQDYLPMLPSFKMNMNLAFGTGVPVFFPNANHHTVVKRTPPFRRVDIGFAYEVIGPRQQKLKKGILKHFTQMDVYFEVLNLLDISNVISYLWVKDNQNMVYLIPNTLTPRQLNLKVAVKF